MLGKIIKKEVIIPRELYKNTVNNDSNVPEYFLMTCCGKNWNYTKGKS